MPAFTLAARSSRRRPKKRGAANIASGISDPALRAKVTPDYQIGCKRILISNDYYPALDRDDVDLVTDGIREITPTGIVTADGTEREVDCLIVATGFHTTDQPIAAPHQGPRRPHARRRLARERHGGVQGHHDRRASPTCSRSSAPTPAWATPHGVHDREPDRLHRSAPCSTMGERGLATVEPRGRRAGRRGTTTLHRRMARTVWSTGGCASWYLDEHGRNTTLWPRTTFTLPPAARVASTPTQYVVDRRVDAPTSKENVA